jgi:hypothetical protein
MLEAILRIFGTGLVNPDNSPGHGMMARRISRQAAHPVSRR